MRHTGLKKLFRVLHPHAPFPRTYDRGLSCLDLALVCDKAIWLVKAMKYLPFYALGLDDHRALFIDFHYHRLRSQMCSEDPTRANHTTPSLWRPAQVRQFIDNYKTMLEQTDMFNKVAEIKKHFAVASEIERSFLAARLNKYDEVWVQLAKSALCQSSSNFTGSRDWSPTFALKGAICRYWNQRLRHYSETGQLNSKQNKTKFLVGLNYSGSRMLKS